MKKILLLTCSILFFQSCATISNSKSTTVKIIANSPITVTYKDSLITPSKKTSKIKPLRQKDSLKFTIHSNNINKTFTFPSKKAIEYWMNIPTTYGLGFLVDYKNNKRFDYKREYYFEVDSINNTIDYLKIRNRKQELFLTISMPYVNSFLLNRNNEQNISSTGFLGVGVGLEYFYHKKRFVDAKVSGFMDFPIFVPAPISDGGNLVREFNASITNNHLLGNVSLGYGLGYSAKYFRIKEDGDILEEDDSNTLALIFPAYYHFKPNFRIGIIFRPSLFDLGRSNNFSYEHSISLDLKWSIKLFKFSQQ